MRKVEGARRRRMQSPLRTLVVTGMMMMALVAGAGSAFALQSASIVVDAKSGKVLFSRAPDALCHPASLTKMMTLFLLFDALDSGRTSLASRITISAHAAAQAPSKLGLKPGQSLTVRDAILAVVTRSANDVAVAIGEYLAGSEDAFAAKMTRTAHAIGMSRTTFENASGLPDPHQYTTARDMATLGRALQDRFPRYFAFFSTASFVFQGRLIPNHNHLLGRVAGVNGIKTGYTRASGYNLVTSVERANRKMIAVVLGGSSGRARDQKMASLVEEYMPAATAGPRTAALVGTGAVGAAPTKVASADEGDADPIPAPRKRPLDPNPTETTSAVPVDLTTTGATTVAAATAPTADNSEGDGGDDDATPPDATQPDAPVAAAAAPAMGPRGWKIQIGAPPSQASATALLDKAAAKAKRVLANAAPFTEVVTKGNSTLYRARVGGFHSREAARAACEYLAKRDFSCLAIHD